MDDNSGRKWQSKNIIPVLALVGYILVNLWGKWPRWSWILLIAAFLAVVLDHYDSFKNLALRWRASRKDDKAARKAFPELQEFVRRFAPFVNRQTNNTLHYIVESDIWHGQADLRADCQLPNVDMWAYPRQYFEERLERQPKTMSELRLALMEFHFLVASYNNCCVRMIFELFPANMRDRITPDTRRKLNLLQQTFGAYLQSYQLFVERLIEDCPSLHGTPSTFNMPKPMV